MSALAVVTMVAVPAVVVAAEASAATSIVVNSARVGGRDLTPGDGVCATGELTGTGAGECTLRAAVEEANALDGAPGAVTITVHDSIAPGTRLTGTPTSADRMRTTSVTPQSQDPGAFLDVTASMTIDLGHRLLADYAVPSAHRGAVFHIDAPDVQIRNSDQVLSDGTSFVVGPNAARIVIDGMHDGTKAAVSTFPRYAPERFVAFREGAEDVLVTGFDVSGFRSTIFHFYGASPSKPMKRIVIDDVDVSYPDGSTCTAQNGSGCGARLIDMQTSTRTWAGVTIEGLEFRGMTVRNLKGQYGLTIGRPGSGADAGSSPKVSDLVVENNEFLNTNSLSAAVQYSFLLLPAGGNLTGTTLIRGNVFQSSGAGSGTAIYGAGARSTKNNRDPSGVTIEGNYFDNFPSAGVELYRMGLVTVTGNTFGARMPGSGGQLEETFDLGASPRPVGLVDNYHLNNQNTSNQSIGTWYPTSATALTTPPPPDAHHLTPAPDHEARPLCQAVVDAARGTVPDTAPATLDAYWTTSANAEVYLGQVTGVRGSTAQLVVPVPIGDVELPDGATVTPVDAATASVSGRVRLQTHLEGGAQLQSSQYSRTVALTGRCLPVLSLGQAQGQHDPAMARDLRFTISSSTPIDPAMVTAQIVSVDAVATPATIDASRLDPRIESVTEVAHRPGQMFDVVVRVDDSATVTVALDPARVAEALGDVLVGASSNASVTYVNPLQATPAELAVVVGDPVGKSYTWSVRDGAPPPQDTLRFASEVSAPDAAPAVALSTSSPVIEAGATSSEPVVVTAAQGPVAPQTLATISASLATTDPNYAGLVLPVVRPYLFATDPAITITKRAYRDVGDPSSPAAIESSGQPVPSGSAISRDEVVCFVYTVTNTSADRWETVLRDVTVTDSDERLGELGLIGTVPTLAVGAAAQFSLCTRLTGPDHTARVQDPPGGRRA